MHKVCAVLLLLHTLHTVASAAEPYCYENETVYAYKPVLKTRTKTVNSTGFFKIFKKTKTLTEAYSEEERHVKQYKLVTKCCEGYEMSKLKICEPVCTKPCPEHASCWEPNRCLCQAGYISATTATTGTHYCEPICADRCHEHAHCAAPTTCICNKGFTLAEDQYTCVSNCTSGCPHGSCLSPELCQCDAGYESYEGSCRPVCTQGDGCQNGICVAPQVCSCGAEYQWHESNQRCERMVCENGKAWDAMMGACVELGSITTLTNDIWTTTEDLIEELAAVASIADDNYLSTITHLESSSAAETATEQLCAAGYIYYQGDCRPELFPSDELDCHFKPCMKNAECLRNGSCACMQGFARQANDSSCQLLSLVNAQLAEVVPASGGLNTLAITSIALGVACMVLAILFVSYKLMRRQRGRLDVEAKTDLYCEYENKSCYADSQLVL